MAVDPEMGSRPRCFSPGSGFGAGEVVFVSDRLRSSEEDPAFSPGTFQRMEQEEQKNPFCIVSRRGEPAMPCARAFTPCPSIVLDSHLFVTSGVSVTERSLPDNGNCEQSTCRCTRRTAR
ncbi:hypothetical protein IF2G_03068 [Cordyceps javanica]|nr:hypothetical protein IF2G_03068 [Cordyceps javanica]